MVRSSQAGSSFAPKVTVTVSDSESEIAVRARQDKSAFEPLYLKYVNLIYRYSLRRLRDQEAAGDATSQIFEKVLIEFPTFRPDRSTFRSWLFAIAHNVLVDIERARRPGHVMEAAAAVIDPGPGPEATALAAEVQREVHLLLIAVPPEQRRVLELRLAGLKTAEIAETLGCSEGSVRVTQHRAVARLRLAMGLGPHRTGGQDA